MPNLWIKSILVNCKLGLTFFSCCLCLVLGCSKRLQPKVTSTTSITFKNNQEFQNLLSNNALTYQTLKLRGRGEYSENQKNISFQYRIHYYHDSLIWCSISAFGFQGMKILIRNDSSFIINYLEKSIKLLKNEEMLAQIGSAFSLHDLQKVLLGELPLLELENNTVMNQKNYISIHNKNSSNKISYKIAHDNLRLAEFYIQNDTLTSSMQYQDYHSVPTFPGNLILTIKGNRNLKISLKHQELEFDPTNIHFQFQIPANYVQE